MRILKSALVALVYVSSAIAYPGPHSQDVSSPAIESIVERDTVLSFSVPKSALLPRAALVDDKKLLACLRAINVDHLSGSFGEKQWNDLHGDSKSKQECIYDKKDDKAWNIQIIHDGDGKYRARVMEGKNVAVVVDVPECPDHKPPTLGRAIHYLRKRVGGEEPPKKC